MPKLNERPVWTPEKVAELKKMVAEGLSNNELMAHFGLTRERIRQLKFRHIENGEKNA